MWYLPLLVIWQHQPTAASVMPRAWESECDIQQPVQGEREKQKCCMAKMELGCGTSPSSCPRARKSLWSYLNCLWTCLLLWYFAARGSRLQCGRTLIFQENSVLSGPWTLSAQMGKGGYGVVRELKHSYSFLLKKPKQTGRSVSWLFDRDGRMKQFSWPKQPYEHFWPWIFITQSKVLNAAALLSSPSPCLAIILGVTETLSPGKISPVLLSHPCLLATQLVWKLQFVFWASCPHTAVVEISMSLCLPTILAAAPLWKEEEGCSWHPTQLGKACRC